MTFTDFENKWVDKLERETLKSFPKSFIGENEYKTINLPGKPLLKGTELFGSYEIIDTNGNTIYNSGNYTEIKYLLYANRKTPTSVDVVTNETALSTIVKNYENYLDEIVKIIGDDFKENYPTSDKEISVVNKVFQLLNLQRY